MSTAFVLGNGTSRQQIKDLAELKKRGTVYACNAIYRDFQYPDFIIAVDPKMIHELYENSIQTKCPVWTNYNNQYKKYSKLNYFKPNRGWSSGPTAMRKALDDGATQLYVFGFDYMGIGGKFNNVYAGSKNYKQVGTEPTYFGNWQNQTIKNVQDFKEKCRMFRVYDPQIGTPGVLNKTEGMTHITFEDFYSKHWPNLSLRT